MAGKTNMMAFAGTWLFIIGLVIAIISGFWALNALWTAILIIIGLVVGLLNVSLKEAQTFLLASVAIVIVSFFGGDILSNVWVGLQRMLYAIIVLIIPATIVVAIKQLFAIAKN